MSITHIHRLGTRPICEKGIKACLKITNHPSGIVPDALATHFPMDAQIIATISSLISKMMTSNSIHQKPEERLSVTAVFPRQLVIALDNSIATSGIAGLMEVQSQSTRKIWNPARLDSIFWILTPTRSFRRGSHLNPFPQFDSFKRR